jgi:hypothetical protein
VYRGVGRPSLARFDLLRAKQWITPQPAASSAPTIQVVAM